MPESKFTEHLQTAYYPRILIIRTPVRFIGTAIHQSREKIRGFCRTVRILGADYGLLKILSWVRILCTIYVVNSMKRKAVDNPRIMPKIGSVNLDSGINRFSIVKCGKLPTHTQPHMTYTYNYIMC